MPRDRRRRHRKEEEKSSGQDEGVAKGELKIAKEDDRVIRAPTTLEELEELLGTKGWKTCPNCNAKTKNVYYCTHCGMNFCENCAEYIIEGKYRVYTCPHCQKKVIVEMD